MMARDIYEGKKYVNSPLAVFIGGVLQKIDELNPSSSKERDHALDALKGLLTFIHGKVLPLFDQGEYPGITDVPGLVICGRNQSSAIDKLLRSTAQYATFEKHEKDLTAQINKILTEVKEVKEVDGCGSEKFLHLSIISDPKLTEKVNNFFIQCLNNCSEHDWSKYKAEQVVYEIESWIFKTKKPENKLFSSEELRSTKEIITSKKTFDLVVHIVTLLETVPINNLSELMSFISPKSEAWIHLPARERKGFERVGKESFKFEKSIVDKETKKITIKSLKI